MINKLHYLFKTLGNWLILVFILITVVIFSLILLPSDSVSQNLIFSYDKIGHALAFGAWTFSLAIMLTYSFNKRPNFLSLFISGLLFGIITELLQKLFPINRAFELLDLVADIFGIVIAGLLFQRLLRHLVKKAII